MPKVICFFVGIASAKKQPLYQGRNPRGVKLWKLYEKRLKISLLRGLKERRNVPSQNGELNKPTKNNMITNYIGQTPIVANINEMIAAYHAAQKKGETHNWRPINLGGWTGTGKSNLARAISEALASEGFNYIEVPQNAGMRDLYQVFGKIKSEDEESGAISAIPYVIFWDEVQSQKKDTLNLFKALTTKVDEVHTINRQGFNFHYDPANHIHVVASNFALDKAFTRRCRNFSLSYYTQAEMRKLAKVMLCDKYNVKIDDKAMEALLSRTKPLAGDLEEVVSPLATRAKANGQSKLTADEVTDVLKKQGFFPQGLRRSDLAILNELAKGATTSAVLKYKVQDEKKKDTQEKVDWLCSMDLVQPVRGGFALTKKGGNYLEKIAEAQKAQKANKGKISK